MKEICLLTFQDRDEQYSIALDDKGIYYLRLWSDNLESYTLIRSSNDYHYLFILAYDYCYDLVDI